MIFNGINSQYLNTDILRKGRKPAHRIATGTQDMSKADVFSPDILRLSKKPGVIQYSHCCRKQDPKERVWTFRSHLCLGNKSDANHQTGDSNPDRLNVIF